MEKEKCIYCNKETIEISYNEDGEACHLSCLENFEEYQEEEKIYKDLIGF